MRLGDDESLKMMETFFESQKAKLPQPRMTEFIPPLRDFDPNDTYVDTGMMLSPFGKKKIKQVNKRKNSILKDSDEKNETPRSKNRQVKFDLEKEPPPSEKTDTV